MNPIFTGIVEGHELKLDSESDFQTYITKFEGKRFELVLRRPKKKHGPKQSGYFHAVIVPLWADYMGYNADIKSEFDEVKKFLKERYGIWITKVMDDGSEVRILKSTAEYNTKDYSKLIDNSRQGGAENGIRIPDPGEVEYDDIPF